MNCIVVTTTVDSDGNLRLDLPLGSTEPERNASRLNIQNDGKVCEGRCSSLASIRLSND